MTWYLISFGAHAMDDFPDDDMPAVARAAHAAVQEAVHAGVLVCAGGLADRPASIAATDGTVTDGPYPEAIGALTIVNVPAREEALKWAAKIAAATRCVQEVRELGPDPEPDEMLRQASAAGTQLGLSPALDGLAESRADLGSQQTDQGGGADLVRAKGASGSSSVV